MNFPFDNNGSYTNFTEQAEIHVIHSRFDVREK